MDISEEDLDWIAHNPGEALALFARALKERGDKIAAEDSLSVFGLPEMTIVSPPPVFIAKKHFKEGGRPVDGVKIFLLGEGFKRNLLGVREEGLGEAVLHMRRMKKGEHGRDVYPRLAGSEEIALAHFWEIMKTDPKPFVVAPCHRLFVWAHWHMDRKGWFIDACSFTARGLRIETDDLVVTG